jgi:hypothetical protein
MPVIVKTPTYDTEFYAEVGIQDAECPETVLARGRAVLRGEDNAEGI